MGLKDTRTYTPGLRPGLLICRPYGAYSRVCQDLYWLHKQ